MRWLSYSVLLFACDSAGSTLLVPDPEVLRPAKPRPPEIKPEDEELFDPDRILEVDIFVSEIDWERIKKQVLPDDYLNQPDCQADPFPEYTFQRATIVIDRRIVEDVGVRQRGSFYQLNEYLPPLEVSFDAYAPNRRFLGERHLFLESAVNDSTGMRTCLGYRAFAAAGIPSPRCAYAHVRLNGMDLGIYSHVEAIDDEFPGVEGPLYEGKASDFRDGWMETFVGPFDRTPIRAVRDALTVSDDQLIETLEGVVDLEAFFRFWAVETVIGHFDGYAGNADRFFVFDPPQGGIRFLPAAPDLAFMDGNPFLRGEQPPSVYAQGELARRLYLHPVGNQRYLMALRTVLEEVWDAEDLLAETVRIDALIGERFFRQDYKASLEQLRSFIRGRYAAVDRDLGAEWNIQRRPTFCIVPRGAAYAEFTTTWDSLPAPGDISAIFESGTGTVAARFDGIDYFQTAPAGACAGETADGYALFATIAETGFGSALALYIAMDPAAVAPGTYQIGEEIYGSVAWYNGADNLPVWSGYLFGTLELNEASTVSGARVEVRVEADLY